MQTKEEVARRLADYHYSVEDGMKEIHRIRHKQVDREASAFEPIKLLEINADGIAGGIMPLGFDADIADGIDYPYLIVEITPEEHANVQSRQLDLPDGWTIGEKIPRVARIAEVA